MGDLNLTHTEAKLIDRRGSSQAGQDQRIVQQQQKTNPPRMHFFQKDVGSLLSRSYTVPLEVFFKSIVHCFREPLSSDDRRERKIVRWLRVFKLIIPRGRHRHCHSSGSLYRKRSTGRSWESDVGFNNNKKCGGNLALFG